MHDAFTGPLGEGREHLESASSFGGLLSFVWGPEQAVSVLNGMFGDLLEERRSRLALPMTLRCGGTELRLDREALADQLADATSAVWIREAARPHAGGAGDRLAGRGRGAEPRRAQYGRSRRPKRLPLRNGERPCVGGEAPARLPARRPLSGAPLEKILHLADFTLTTIANPVTRLVGRVLRRRSAGVKDVRFGALVEEDWSGHDPDALRWPHRTPVPLVATADHYVIAGTLTGRGDHPVGQVFGDPLVTCYSATGRTLPGWGALVADTNLRILPGVGHLALAHHHDVYHQMMAWWAPRDGGERGVRRRRCGDRRRPRRPAT
jgi:hypothetical protein